LLADLVGCVPQSVRLVEQLSDFCPGPCTNAVQLQGMCIQPRYPARRMLELASLTGIFRMPIRFVTRTFFQVAPMRWKTPTIGLGLRAFHFNLKRVSA